MYVDEWIKEFDAWSVSESGLIGFPPYTIDVNEVVTLSNCFMCWFQHIRIIDNDNVDSLLALPEMRPVLKSLKFRVAEFEAKLNQYNGYSFLAGCKVFGSVDEFYTRVRLNLRGLYAEKYADRATCDVSADDWRGVELSLLDIAVISGDTRRARILCGIGLPQLYQFQVCHICRPWASVCDSRSTRAVMAARDSCKPLFDQMQCDDELVGRAIAGKRALIVEQLVVDPAKSKAGNYMFEIKPQDDSYVEEQLGLRMRCIEIAVAAGIDVRFLKVDPCLAVEHAVRWRHFGRGGPGYHLDFMMRKLHQDSPTKWRPNQSLLQMAILCGQQDVVKPLILAHCEAISLTSDDLVGPLFHESGLDEFGISVTVTVNGNRGAAKAARLAYHFSKCWYQMVIVQMSGWWKRVRWDDRTDTLAVLNRDLINNIAAFALAVPPLPEILLLPPPFGTRRAVKRAARWAGHSERMGARSCAVAGVETVEPDEKIAAEAEVIETVIDDSNEPVAKIPEAEADNASRALWEAAVESRVASPALGQISEHASSVSEAQYRLTQLEDLSEGVQEISHEEPAQPQTLEQDLINCARPVRVEPIMVLRFRGNAELLRERLGQDRIRDSRILGTGAEYWDALMARMASQDGKDALQKIRLSMRTVIEELSDSSNCPSQELAEIAPRQNFSDSTSRPGFANGASVFVTPAAASELESAIRESEIQLGKQHVLVSESYVPLVLAAVEVSKSSGDRRREPKEDIKSRTELARGIFSQEAAQACREEDTMEELGMLRQQETTSIPERLTHSTGSHPTGYTWSFGPVRKHFQLSKMP